MHNFQITKFIYLVIFLFHCLHTGSVFAMMRPAKKLPRKPYKTHFTLDDIPRWIEAKEEDKQAVKKALDKFVNIQYWIDEEKEAKQAPKQAARQALYKFISENQTNLPALFLDFINLHRDDGDEIARYCRRILSKLHPDKHPGQVEMFKIINNIFDDYKNSFDKLIDEQINDLDEYKKQKKELDDKIIQPMLSNFVQELKDEKYIERSLAYNFGKYLGERLTQIISVEFLEKDTIKKNIVQNNVQILEALAENVRTPAEIQQLQSLAKLIEE